MRRKALISPQVLLLITPLSTTAKHNRLTGNEASFRMASSYRGVAQPGSALGLGPRGRWFESNRPDQNRKEARVKESETDLTFALALFAFCARSSAG